MLWGRERRAHAGQPCAVSCSYVGGGLRPVTAQLQTHTGWQAAAWLGVSPSNSADWNLPHVNSPLDLNSPWLKLLEFIILNNSHWT